MNGNFVFYKYLSMFVVEADINSAITICILKQDGGRTDGKH